MNKSLLSSRALEPGNRHASPATGRGPAGSQHDGEWRHGEKRDPGDSTGAASSSRDRGQEDAWAVQETTERLLHTSSQSCHVACCSRVTAVLPGGPPREHVRPAPVIGPPASATVHVVTTSGSSLPPIPWLVLSGGFASVGRPLVFRSPAYPLRFCISLCTGLPPAPLHFLPGSPNRDSCHTLPLLSTATFSSCVISSAVQGCRGVSQRVRG